MASLYIVAVGTLCAEWQKHLPYSIKPTALNVSFGEEHGRKNIGGVGVSDGKDSIVNAGAANQDHGDGSVDGCNIENANGNGNTVEVGEENVVEKVDGEERGDVGGDLRAVTSGHGAEEGAGPQQDKERREEEVMELKKSWLDVGGVLGNDDLYLRTSRYLEGTL